jgi:hypothetical protein
MSKHYITIQQEDIDEVFKELGLTQYIERNSRINSKIAYKVCERILNIRGPLYYSINFTKAVDSEKILQANKKYLVEFPNFKP